MARLSSPSLPLNLNEPDIDSFISEFLSSKNWKSFDLINKKLVLVPYFSFSVELVELNEDNSVKSSETKNLFLNTIKNELEFFDFSVEEKNVFELPEAISYEILKPKYNFKTIEKLALIKASSFFKVSRQQLIFLDGDLFFVPFWFAVVSLKDEKHELIINAFSKKILNESKIKTRNKTLSELAVEAFSDISNPSSWKEYSGNILKMPFNTLPKKSLKKNSVKALLFNQSIQLLILIIILILLLYLLFFG